MEPEIIDLLDSDDETPDAEVGTQNIQVGTQNIQATCYYCGSIFTVEAAFMNHMEFFHRLGPVAKCPFCYEVCPKKALDNHIKFAHPSQPSCSASTSSGTTTKTLPSQHPACSYSTPAQQFSCVTCGAKFPFKQNLDDHMSVHVYEKKFSIAADAVANESVEKKHKCNICLKSFYVEGALNLHKKKKHILLRSNKEISQKIHRIVQNSQKFECELCELSFTTSRGLRMHKFHKHKKQKADHAKKVTGQSTIKNKFVSSSQEYQVIPPSSGDQITLKGRGTKCPLCSKIFKNGRGVTTHMIWQHNKCPLKKGVSSSCKKTPGIKPVKRSKKGRFCRAKKKSIPPICTSNTSSECLVLQKTVQNTNPSKSFKLASCSFCKEKFTFCYNYRQHMETHPIKKNLVCHICAGRFAFKSNLETHELIEHSPYAKQLVHCSLCARPFSSQQLRDIHFRTCHKTYLQASQTVHGRPGKSLSIIGNYKSTNNTNTSQSAPASQFLTETLNTPCIWQGQDEECPERNIDLFRDVAIPRCEATPPLRQSKDPLVISMNETNNSSFLSVDNVENISEFTATNIKPVSKRVSRDHSLLCNICGKLYSRERGLLYHVLLSHPFEDFPLTWEQPPTPLHWHTLSVADARTFSSSSDPPFVSSSPSQQALYEEECTRVSIHSLDLSSLNESSPSSSSLPQNEIVEAYSNYFFPVTDNLQ